MWRNIPFQNQTGLINLKKLPFKVSNPKTKKMKCPQLFVFLAISVISLLRVIGAYPSYSDIDSEFRANAELICYECARTPENDSCAFDIKVIPEVTAVGQVRFLFTLFAV